MSSSQSDPFERVRPNSSAVKEAMERHEVDQRARAGRYYKAFQATEDGEKLMEELVQTYVFRPPLPPDTTQFEAGIVEGQRQVVLDIIAQLNIIAGIKANE